MDNANETYFSLHIKYIEVLRLRVRLVAGYTSRPGYTLQGTTNLKLIDLTRVREFSLEEIQYLHGFSQVYLSKACQT